MHLQNNSDYPLTDSPRRGSHRSIRVHGRLSHSLWYVCLDGIQSHPYSQCRQVGTRIVPVTQMLTSTHSFFGRTLPVPLTKKYGQFNVLIIASALSVAVILGSWLPSRGNAAIIVFTVLFGFVSGTTIGLGPMLVVSISPPQEVGYRMGAVFAFSGIAALVGPPIAGAIISRSNGSYVYACLFSGVSYLICTILLVVLKGRVAGWNLLKMA